MIKLSTILCLLSILHPCKGGCAPSGIGSQSGYFYSDTEFASEAGTPVCDWNITIVDYLKIIEEQSQGIFLLSTNYSLDDHHYDVELFEKDCKTAPTGPNNFPLIFENAFNDPSNITKRNDVELLFIYNQTMIQESSLWKSTKTGGVAEFCIRLNNYLSKRPHAYYGPPGPGFGPFAVMINFKEVNYRIEVDSTADFDDVSIDIVRLDAEERTEFINYEEDIVAYACNNNYQNMNKVYRQGDFVNICVETVEGSALEVHSIKELTVSQWDAFATPPSVITDYEYVTDFVDSPLSDSECINSNTTTAVCKTKLQLIADWFIPDQITVSMSILNVEGVVKLDYLGRRLSVNVPINVRVGELDTDGTDEVAIRRAVGESTTTKTNFDFMLHLATPDEIDSRAVSFGIIFSTAVAFIAGLFTVLS